MNLNSEMLQNNNTTIGCLELGEEQQFKFQDGKVFKYCKPTQETQYVYLLAESYKIVKPHNMKSKAPYLVLLDLLPGTQTSETLNNLKESAEKVSGMNVENSYNFKAYLNTTEDVFNKLQKRDGKPVIMKIKVRHVLISDNAAKIKYLLETIYEKQPKNEKLKKAKKALKRVDIVSANSLALASINDTGHKKARPSPTAIDEATMQEDDVTKFFACMETQQL